MKNKILAVNAARSIIRGEKKLNKSIAQAKKSVKHSKLSSRVE